MRRASSGPPSVLEWAADARYFPPYTMCGIVGYVGKQKAAPLIIEGLKRLEYRGYDSAGVAVLHDGQFTVAKKIGRVANLEQETARHRLNGNWGIGHTRWATHGGVTDQN